MQALTTFFSGASSINTTTYIVNNILLGAIRDLCDSGLDGVTKTLLTAVLLGCNEKYVKTFDILCAMVNDDKSCWGCGKSMDGIVMSQVTWHKIIYVAVHTDYLDMPFFSGLLTVIMKFTGDINCRVMVRHF